MYYIRVDFINPIKKFTCTAMRSISMKSQKPSIECIMKIILHFATNFHTIMKIGISMSIRNITFMTGIFKIIC